MPEITAPQYAVLVALDERGELNQTQIGRLTSMDKSTLGAMLDRLEARGDIDKAIDPNNRRRRTVRLTSQGRRVVAEQEAAALAAEAWIVGALGENEAPGFLAHLRTLARTPPPTSS
ncbi:putative MarR family transcriptional regulator [Nocardia brasiliensis NBRC 14402]|uniref:MarR family winged helix-turn-helix transcriptional regulator n=1 Tax=Nocardia brasiliensis TaxID=37326 RepID=UPI00031881B3|nr:MarR family transcriptional regulator [Nocardia brasiliensis]ASF09473.1 MarR family transcriptional regulator [Nocardia brasiliensis]GAJ86587.1 putative MarR family transcriptional regulator [Nocardia brasiliensis NBRC 14402]SUB39816.1 Multiple antibiotic resistance protein marR [Nocardia brasiliensis]